MNCQESYPASCFSREESGNNRTVDLPSGAVGAAGDVVLGGFGRSWSSLRTGLGDKS